jgi:D-cysteine desulfhydrase
LNGFNPSGCCCRLQACGSGGTTAGIALGVHLSGMATRVHAYGVCDDPAYFYDYVDGLLAALGATPQAIGGSLE